MFDWLKDVLRSRYVRLLEDENTRLKAENRAFLNSLLGTAGFPPVEFPPAKVSELSRVRRRSWHQIQAAKENEAVREDGRAHA
jgi:hypothetical protein